jgi:membrane fusion protein (multidrug efflux system)
VKAVMLVCVLAGLPFAAHADNAASVLVQTEAPKQGSVPDVIAAYGSAAPAMDGGMTLSVQQDGRVLAIAVTPGEMVRAGDRLIDFSASATASSTYQQAMNALALARTQRAHTAQLLAQQLATRDQLAQADKAVADAQAVLDALEREGAGRPVRTLAAPFDGVVTTIPVTQGQRVPPSAPLLTLTRLDGLVVTIGIEPGDRTRVRAGQKVRLDPLAGGTSLDGQLIRVDGVLNPRTRLIDADVSVPKGAVMSGEAFRADVTVGELQGWIVPHDAVLIDAKGAYVFQVSAGKAARVDVSVVKTVGETDIVEGLLDPQHPLVVQGNYQLSNGTTVREGTS